MSIPVDPTIPVRRGDRLTAHPLDEVNSFGLVPPDFDRPEGDTIQVGPITLRGTF